MLSLLRRIFFGKRSKRISKATSKKLVSYIKKAEKLGYKAQIIEYDKIYHVTLKELGYSGTFGEILKSEPREINNLQNIWKYHKLRNTLVHELGDESEKFLEQNAQKYKKILRDFIQRVTL